MKNQNTTPSYYSRLYIKGQYRRRQPLVLSWVTLRIRLRGCSNLAKARQKALKWRPTPLQNYLWRNKDD